MKPVLVLGPEERGAPALERGQLDLCRVPTKAEVVTDVRVYDSVIVINDGGADTIRRLRLALALRERNRHVHIGMLTYLDGPLPMLELARELKAELKDEVLSLEYQAV